MLSSSRSQEILLIGLPITDIRGEVRVFFLLERRRIVRFPQNAGYDDEYVKRKNVGQGSTSTKYDAWRFERDIGSDWVTFVVYYQQAWEFAQNHRTVGERLRWASRAETLADVILHHMLCANKPKAVDYWIARQSEASHLIRALLASM